MEQSISDSTINDIEDEKIIAEVEVTSAIIEAYIKYSKNKIFSESNSEEDADKLDRKMDESISDDIKKTVSKSINEVEKSSIAKKTNDRLKVFWNGAKAFFKAIWNWIINSTTRLVGIISKHRLDLLIKQLENLDDSTKENYKKLMPEPLKKYVIDNDSSHGNPFLGIASTITYYRSYFELFKTLAESDNSNSNNMESNIQKFIEDTDKFHKNITKEIKLIHASKSDNKHAGIYINYKETMEILKYIREQTNLEWYAEAKNIIDSKSMMIKILNKLNEKSDDESVEKLYKAIKDAYSSLTLYITAFLNMVVMTLDCIRPKDSRLKRKVDNNEN
jgi:hypothetical protein